jgi:glycosyltransferase 2 family protein
MGRESGSNPQRIPRWFLPALGYLLSAASLIWVFHDFDVHRTLQDFAALDWRYVSIAVIFDLAVYLAHAWRWNILLRPVAKLSFWRTAQAIYIGLYANEILPLRTGEVIRCYLQAHWNKLSMSLALSSAVIERILDGVWLVTAMYITTHFLPLAGYLVYATQTLAAITCGLLALLAFIAFYKQRAHTMFSESRWMRGLRHVVDGIHTMGNRRTMAGALGASFVYLALQVVPVWALMEGYGLNLSIWAAVAVLIIIRVGTAIPSAPGNAGLLQLFCVLGLRLFDVPEATAKGFSLMMFGVLTLPLLFGGFVAVALTGLKIGDIRTRAASATAQPALEVSSD